MNKAPHAKPAKHEVRAIRGSELRATTNDDGSRTISGFIPYNSMSVDLGGFREVIAPGAFADALEPEADVLSLYNHQIGNLLGRTTSGTLTLSDSDKGLRYSVKLPKTSVATDLAELVDRGDITATSFGFDIDDWDTDQSWDYAGDQIIRTLKKVALFEVSPVACPAYPDAAIAIRSAPRAIRAKLKPVAETRSDDDDDACECDCDKCQAGDCTKCSDPDCDDPNCDCDNAEEASSERSRLEMQLELRKRQQ